MLEQKNLASNSLLKKKIRVFFSNKRAKVSLLLFAVLFVLSLFSELIANDKPLAIEYDGNWYFPIFKNYTEQTFDGDFPTPADYKDPYIVSNIKKKGNLWFTLIPFSFEIPRISLL